MTDQEIRQIITRLDKQSRESKEFHADMTKEMKEFKEEMAPIQDLFESVQGFDRIAVWIVKFVLGLAAFITAIGTIIYAIRRIIINQ